MPSRHRGLRLPLVAFVGAIVLALAAGAVVAVIAVRAHDRGATATTTTTAPTTTTPGGAPTTASLPALQVASADPANGAVGVAANGVIMVAFSAELSSTSALPTLAPSTSGSWSVKGSTLVFTPTVPFIPLSQVTLTIPGGSGGVRAVDGGALPTDVVDNFTVAGGSVLRLQQLLALLEYSPLQWTPAGPSISTNDTAAQIAAFTAPPAGTFAWRKTGWPSELTALWQPGVYNVMTQGLVMSFEADHGLYIDAMPTAGLWNDLLTAIANAQLNGGGYNFAIANKISPETLTIWHDAAVVLKATANTGIAASPTPDGVFPVFARFRNQVMRGTNPGGSKYADPVQYVAYFHDGDAVHYLARADYGIPQSLGCVELKLSDAARAWPWLAYGTLVNVIG